MGRRLTLILGGARSGKSNYAEGLASRHAQVLYVATAEAWDDEMAQRIAAHKAQRPAHWRTLEAPRNVGAALALAGHVEAVLIDCLTLLANNVIIVLPPDASETEATVALLAEVEAILATYAASSAEWIIVSNEVGLGIVPAYPLGRIYRDALGRANQRLATVADSVIFMVAGLPMVVKG